MKYKSFFLILLHIAALPLLAINVTTTADSGAGSFRAAIDAVNAGSTSIINFQNPGTITILSSLPTINGFVTITGTAAQIVNGSTSLTALGVGPGYSMALQLPFTCTGALSVGSFGTLTMDVFSSTLTVGAFSGSGTVALGTKNLVFGNELSTAFSGNFTGSGLITKQGSSTFTFTGEFGTANLVINEGRFVWSRSSTSLLNSVQIASSATLDVSGFTSGSVGTLVALSGGGTLVAGSKNVDIRINGATTFSGSIEGTGTISKRGNGVYSLTGNSPFSGTFNILEGDVILSGNGQFDPSVNISLGNRTLDISGITNSSLAVGNISSISGTLALGTKTLITTVTTDSTYLGTITGSGGIEKRGSAILYFEGSGSTFSYSGTTHVAEGELNLGNATLSGPVQVDAGAILSGTGTINNGAAPSQIYGTIEPLGTTGVITFNGNYIQESGSTLHLSATPTTSGAIGIGSGYTATLLSGSSLYLDLAAGSYPPGTVFDVFVPGSFITGSFTTITSSDPSLQFTFDSNGQLILGSGVSPIIYTGHGNARAVSFYLNSLSPAVGSDLANVMTELGGLSGASLEKALNQIAPSLYKGMSEMTQENSFMVREFFLRHLETFSWTGCMQNKKRDKLIEVWGGAYGEELKQDSRNGLIGFQASAGTVLLGADVTAAENIYFGIGGGYSTGGVHWSDGQGRGYFESYYGSLYFSGFSEIFFINTLLLGVYHDLNGSRAIAFCGRNASQNHDGATLLAHVDSGLRLGGDFFEVRPFGSFDYQYGYEAGFAESGAQSLNLVVQAIHPEMMRFEAGIESAKCLFFRRFFAVPTFRLGWIREIRTQGAAYVSALTGQGGSFQVSGLYPCQTLVDVGLSLMLRSAEASTTFVMAYDGSFGDRFIENSVSGQISCRF